MPTQPQGWQPHILYCFFIGNRDRESRVLPDETLDRAIRRLGKRLLEAFEGKLRHGPHQAEGETKQWGKEGATLYLALCPAAQEGSADRVVEEEADALLAILAQDEVWIAKDQWQLLIARRTAA